MSSIRGCCEICFSPNTVSKFVRIFPRAALLFIILHVGIMIYTIVNSGARREAVQLESSQKVHLPIPVDVKEKDIAIHKVNIPRLMSNNTKEHKKRKKRPVKRNVENENL